MIERFRSLGMIRFKSIQYRGDEREIIKTDPDYITV